MLWGGGVSNNGTSLTTNQAHTFSLTVVTTSQLVSEFDIGYRHGTRLIMLISPMLFVSALCHLMITDAPLKNRLQIRINAFFARYRGFEYKEDGIEKKNQFGLGELSYNYLAIFLVTMPVIFFFILTLDNVLGGEEVSGEDKWKAISNASALAGTLALSFFLIPVTRHSILLVAMGWNPIQALRVHIWAGFTSL